MKNFENSVILDQIERAVILKRCGDYHLANNIYLSLNIIYPDNPIILKSWAKTLALDGYYDIAINLFFKASIIFKNSGFFDQLEECNYHASKLIYFVSNYNPLNYDFKSYLISISGNNLNFRMPEFKTIDNEKEFLKNIINKELFELDQDTKDEKLNNAVQNNDLHQAMQLVIAGADVNNQIDLYYLPLEWASSIGNYYPMVEFLLEKGADPDLTLDTIEGKKSQPCLILATLHGHLSIVELLVENGKADVNIQNEAGNTPMMIAGWHGHIDIAFYLLSKGADIHLTNMLNQNALMISCFTSQNHMIKFFIENKADKFIISDDGDTCDQILKENNNLEGLEILNSFV